MLSRRAALLGLATIAFAGGARADCLCDEASSAIMSAGSRAAKVAALRSVGGITILNLKAWLVPAPFVLAPVEVTAEKHHADILRLRAALRANPVTAQALAKRGVAIDHIVAVHIYSDGGLRVYVI